MDANFPIIISLIVSSANVVTTAIPDPSQEDLHPTVNNSNMDENTSTRRPTALDILRQVLLIIRESVDVFPPLQSIVGSILFILDSVEVQPLSLVFHPKELTSFLANDCK